MVKLHTVICTSILETEQSNYIFNNSKMHSNNDRIHTKKLFLTN